MEGQYDFLKFQNDKNTQQYFGQNEKIILSAKVKKFNENNSQQTRNLVITEQVIYNFKNFRLKRKAFILNIQSISQSTISDEFAIHIPSSYDFRFLSDKKQLIIDVIVKLYKNLTIKILPIFNHDIDNLEKYTTTKIHKKKGICLIPNFSTAKLEEQYNQSEITNQILNFPQNLTSQSFKEDNFAKNKEEVKIIDQRLIQNKLYDYLILKELKLSHHSKLLLVFNKQNENKLKNLKKNIDIQQFLVIIKIIDLELINQQFNSQFPILIEDLIKEYKEISINKNFVEIFDFHETQSFLIQFQKYYQQIIIYYIFNKKSYGDLLNLLQIFKKLSEEQIRPIIYQIANSLIQLHEKNLIYKKLYLENVVLDEQGQPKLIFFNSDLIIDYNYDNISLGKIQFSAPETILNGSFDKGTDWFQLGVIIYILVIGVPPFFNEDQYISLSLILEGEVTFPSQIKISEECIDLIYRVKI